MSNVVILRSRVNCVFIIMMKWHRIYWWNEKHTSWITSLEKGEYYDYQNAYSTSVYTIITCILIYPYLENEGYKGKYHFKKNSEKKSWAGIWREWFSVYLGQELTARPLIPDRLMYLTSRPSRHAGTSSRVFVPLTYTKRHEKRLSHTVTHHRFCILSLPTGIRCCGQCALFPMVRHTVSGYFTLLQDLNLDVIFYCPDTTDQCQGGNKFYKRKRRYHEWVTNVKYAAVS